MISEILEQQEVSESIEGLGNSSFYSKHYITLDENNNIVNGFSDVFYQPSESDVCINNLGGRHFVIDGIENPQLIDKQVYLYKYVDLQIVKKTDEEMSLEIKNIATPLSEEQKYKDMVNFLMTQFIVDNVPVI